MSIKIIIPPSFRHATDNTKEFRTDGKTISDCLDAINKRFPKMKQLIFDDDGKLLRHIAIFVNGERVDPGTMKALTDEDELVITTVFAGG